MTSSSKSAQVRDVAVTTGGTLVKAAKIFSTGSAGIGLEVGRRGLGLARREIRRRKVKRSMFADQPHVTSRNRKILASVTVIGAVAGLAVLVARRRFTPEPPAEAPPRLEDYTDSPPESPATLP